ncbi:MAG: YqaJ viral recombinase family protein [Burkholderiales bacterium]|nr:YqaJ viral recombinase family protein [Burkholderiales bacterium]
MKTHQLIQGSPEWKAYRAEHFNASDAPAMMGCSPYKTRAQLLRELHTGVAPEVDVATQMRFANGHRAEALARPLAEEIIGQDLYPVTGSEGRLSASFDGLTLDESESFEHKALNAELRAAFSDMEHLPAAGRELERGRCLPLMYRVQMEQQLLISQARRTLFMASAWDADGNLLEEHDCWYYPDLQLRQQIIDGWAQFERDLAAYVLPETSEPAPVGKAPETLPALRIEVTGEVTASNLAEFKATALEAIRSVNRTLRTDQDFADAEKAVKWCSEVESRLAAAKQHALAQTTSIDELFKAIDDISAEAKRVRLDLDKLVTRRKTEVKEEAVTRARRALDDHIRTLNAEITPLQLQPVQADFAGSIKGLRSVASMQDALDQTLAAAKIAADGQARTIRTNAAAFEQIRLQDDYGFLFRDLSTLVHKAPDDFAAVVRSRIAEHKLAEADKERKRAEAERQRQEAEALAAAQRQAEEAERAAATPAAPAVPPNAALAPAAAPQPAAAAAPNQSPALAPAPTVAPLRAAPRADEPATLKLGTVCERLGFTMTAAFVGEALKVAPARVDGAARLFRESDFDRICTALQQHIESVRIAQLQAKAA